MKEVEDPRDAPIEQFASTRRVTDEDRSQEPKGAVQRSDPTRTSSSLSVAVVAWSCLDQLRLNGVDASLIRWMVG